MSAVDHSKTKHKGSTLNYSPATFMTSTVRHTEQQGEASTFKEKVGIIKKVINDAVQHPRIPLSATLLC